MEVVLDTNFIISCVKKKIDFLEELEKLGFKVLLPREVLQELKDLKMESYHPDRVAIDIALELFEKRKVKKITLGKKPVDLGLIEIGKKGAYIATLDNAIRRSVPNKIIISEQKNNVAIERS